MLQKVKLITKNGGLQNRDDVLDLKLSTVSNDALVVCDDMGSHVRHRVDFGNW